MSVALMAVLALLAAAIAMFAINKPRMDAVALLMLTVLPFTGAVTMNEALAGFSDGNIVLIAALFVIGEGLVRTGVARKLGDWLTVRAGSSETRLLVLLMVTVGGLGATMSSTAVTAIFIPVVIRIAQKTATAPSRLMMPLSTAALISGMTTLVATAPNLVVNSELVHHLERQGVEGGGFHFFSFTPFGLPVLVLGVVYMLFARHWLPDRGTTAGEAAKPVSLADWIEEYQLAGRERRVRILPGSPLAGAPLESVTLGSVTGAHAIAVERGGALLQPTGKLVLQGNDTLLLDLPEPETADGLDWREYGLVNLPLGGTYFTDHSQEIGMAEVLLPPDSSLLGKSPTESRLRDLTGLTAIGLRRDQEALPGSIADEKLEVGDTLLVVGPWNAIQKAMARRRQLIVFNVPAEIEEILPAPGKVGWALACLALVVGLMITGVVPNVQAALIGCLLMGLFGCIDLASAYRSIDWKTIVLIVGMLPFSIALQRTGGVQMASDGLMAVTQAMGTYGVLASLFVITAILGMFISNTATAVLMAPVALAMADEMNASPYPFAMIVALAASSAFMTPVSSPVNTLVVTPGGYTFADFLRIGVPFTVVVMIVCVVLVPWLLPL